MKNTVADGLSCHVLNKASQKAKLEFYNVAGFNMEDDNVLI